MISYFDVLNRFLIIIVAVGAAAPFAAWLIARQADRLMKRAVPPVIVEAVVVTKRIEVKTRDSNNKVRTIYYETFEPAGGKRQEFEVSAQSFAMTAVGDRGKLSCHMGRFEGFTVD